MQRRSFSQVPSEISLNFTPIKDKKSHKEELTLTQKAKAYLQKKDGRRISDIASSAKKQPETMRKFLLRTNTTKSFESQHEKKGRFPKGSTTLTDRQKGLLEKWLREGDIRSSHEGWIRLSNIRNMRKVSFNVVNNYVKSLGQWRNPILRTVLSFANKEKRLNHCRKFLNRTFRNVLFTDESVFQLNQNTLKVFWFRENSPPTTIKYNPNYSLMVWGGVCFRGKTPLTFVEGWVNAEKYQAILKEQKKSIKKMWRKGETWHFQQDNARCHTTKSSLDFIHRHLTKNILPHPPQSPDLNPIELVWVRMKRLVQLSRPRNKRELRTSVERAWKQIKVEFIRSCIGGLKKRMGKIIEKNGEVLY